MRTHTAVTHVASADSPVDVLRWTLERGGESITCEVDRAARHYDVCVVPHWDLAASVIETFDGPVGALRRHAELVQCLRDAGWKLAEYGRTTARPSGRGGRLFAA